MVGGGMVVGGARAKRNKSMYFGKFSLGGREMFQNLS